MEAARLTFEAAGTDRDTLFDSTLRNAIEAESSLDSSPQLVRRLYEIFRANYEATLNYRHEPLDRDITLLRSIEELPAALAGPHRLVGSMFASPTNGWEILTPRSLRVIEVAGDHLSMMSEPHVADVAAKLPAELAVVELVGEDPPAMIAPTVAVVGAGIGGLTPRPAVALRAKGIDVEIYEAASEPRATGTALGLASNATKVLRSLGIDLTTDACCRALEHFERRTARGALIRALPGAAITAELGHPFVSIHRNELIRTLRLAAADTPIHYGAEVADVEIDRRGAHAALLNGAEVSAGVLIGADGIGSVVRWIVGGEQALSEYGYVCWLATVRFTHPRMVPGYTGHYWGKKGSDSGSSTSAAVWPTGGERRTCPRTKHVTGTQVGRTWFPRSMVEPEDNRGDRADTGKCHHQCAGPRSANPQAVGHGASHSAG